MKKIYTIISVALFGGLTAQVVTIPNSNKIPFISKSGVVTHQKSATSPTGVKKGRYDVGYSLLTANGVLPTEIGGSSPKVRIFVDPTFCDSTVRQSFSGSAASYINTIKFGTTFDPKSIIFDNFSPLFTPTDSYYLDTVWVAGVYQRKTSAIDTLMVEIVWGDTANTNVFGRWSYASPYTYYGTWATPKFTTSAVQQGNKAFLSAPSTNKMVIKRVLTDADTAFFRINDYAPFVLNGALGQLIPANNIVSANVTYIPGQVSYPVGTVSYNPGTGTVTATMNGFAAVLYQQSSPAQPVAGTDYFDDLQKGKNCSQVLFPSQRYGTDAGIFLNSIRGSIASSYWIDFSVHGNSSVGIKETENKGFALGQNTPNPFNGESKVAYMLDKEAHTATFTITDVMGRVVSTQVVDATKGTHTVTLNAQAAGVYYYSLSVDGVTTTKKMIAQ